MKQILCHFYRGASDGARGKSEAENFARPGRPWQPGGAAAGCLARPPGLPEDGALKLRLIAFQFLEVSFHGLQFTPQSGGLGFQRGRVIG